jgi:hypothetical protein
MRIVIRLSDRSVFDIRCKWFSLNVGNTISPALSAHVNLLAVYFCLVICIQMIEDVCTILVGVLSNLLKFSDY